MPAEAAIPLPAGLSAAEGALIEPLTVGLYGAKIGQIGKDDRVLVLGGGSIALTAVYWSKKFGVERVAVLSRSEKRKAMALAMGADAFIAMGGDAKSAIAAAVGGEPTVVFECIGVAGSLGQAIDHCGLFGRVVSLGLGSAPDPIIPAMAGMKGVSLQFPVGYSHDDFRYTAKAMKDGTVDASMMVTSVIDLAGVPQRFAELFGSHRETKVQIAPSGNIWDGAGEENECADL